jgi:hypothetical protein
MAHNILKKFGPSAKLLDEMIFKLETNLGRNHTASPMTTLYQKYGYSTQNGHQSAAPIKEEKKVEEEK